MACARLLQGPVNPPGRKKRAPQSRAGQFMYTSTCGQRMRVLRIFFMVCQACRGSKGGRGSRGGRGATAAAPLVLPVRADAAGAPAAQMVLCEIHRPHLVGARHGSRVPPSFLDGGHGGVSWLLCGSGRRLDLEGSILEHLLRRARCEGSPPKLWQNKSPGTTLRRD